MTLSDLVLTGRIIKSFYQSNLIRLHKDHMVAHFDLPLPFFLAPRTSEHTTRAPFKDGGIGARDKESPRSPSIRDLDLVLLCSLALLFLFRCQLWLQRLGLCLDAGSHCIHQAVWQIQPQDTQI